MSNSRKCVMSRRSMLFMFAALIILLYFTIIIFMLSPLHGRKGSFYGNNYLNHLSLRQTPEIKWCKELQWRSPHTPNVTALVSYPGSGNTWLRYLLQQVTGILTGSIYMDHSLRVHGFPAENVTDGSVLVVKTHEAPPVDSDKFKSAVLLIRNPRDAILADFNRLHRGHVGSAPRSAFEKRPNELRKRGKLKGADWVKYVFSQLGEWETLHKLWLERFPMDVHIVFYEVLVRDPKRSLEGILQFLNYTVTEEDMNCALANKEGIYRRRKKLRDFDPFTAEMYQALEVVKNRVLKMIEQHNNKRNESNRNRANKDGYFE